jgi:hypothetical protein
MNVEKIIHCYEEMSKGYALLALDAKSIRDNKPSTINVKEQIDRINKANSELQIESKKIRETIMERINNG